MTGSFRELQGQMSPEAQQRTHERVARELLRMNLQEIRRCVGCLSPQEVTSLLETSRATLCALEKRAAADRR